MISGFQALHRGQGAGGAARSRDRRVPADILADSLATVPPTLRQTYDNSNINEYSQETNNHTTILLTFHNKVISGFQAKAPMAGLEPAYRRYHADHRAL
ncbi:hypothetical protein PoB_004616800 [Plakobranchus ocellatus]|uniref:Uncharacterized protein n=1 Tax=Plakobranchus ocellatus TaxID=259542 RepID=A0AAV4BLG2_9GAST|nr:hypothetical protein PoB_004616800 [Plakobranchus ocellatus]